MISEDDYLQVLKGTLVGKQMTAINAMTLMIATSAGDIIKIRDLGVFADSVGLAVVTSHGGQYTNRDVADVRFTHTLLATFAGAKRWKISLDAQLDSDKTGGWYTIASSSVRCASEGLGPAQPSWMNDVVVTRGKSLLALARRDAGLT